MTEMNRYICLPCYQCRCYPPGKAVSQKTMLNHRRMARNKQIANGLDGNLPRGPRAENAESVLQEYAAIVQHALMDTEDMPAVPGSEQSISSSSSRTIRAGTAPNANDAEGFVGENDVPNVPASVNSFDISATPSEAHETPINAIPGSEEIQAEEPGIVTAQYGPEDQYESASDRAAGPASSHGVQAGVLATGAEVMPVGGNESERESNASQQAIAASNAQNDHSIMYHLQSADPLSSDGEGNAAPFWFEADEEFGVAETDDEGEWEAEGPDNWDHVLSGKSPFSAWAEKHQGWID